MSDNILLEIKYKPDTDIDHPTKSLPAFISRLEEQLLNKKSGDIRQFLFLLYAHKYAPCNILEEKAVETATQIYRRSKQQNVQQHIQDYFGGINKVVVVLEHISRNRLLDTDIARVFKKVDFAVHNHLLYKKERNLALADGLTGKGLLMFHRLQKTVNFKTDEELKPIEALIKYVDKVEEAFDKGETGYPGTSYWDDLCVAAILLAKILKKNIYPEMTGRLIERILDAFAFILKESSLGKLKEETRINISYAYWKMHQILFVKSNAFDPISEVIPSLTNSLLDCNTKMSMDSLRLVQQLNELHWFTGEERIKIFTGQLLTEMIAEYENNGKDKNRGLSGEAGLGLLVLSHLSADCLGWDEVIGLR